MTTIRLRRPEEVEKIRESARIVAQCLEYARTRVAPGLSLLDLDREIEGFIREQGATPSFKGYHGFPASTCLSVNSQVVHGIPGDYVLLEGDILGVDVGAYKDGYHGDGARTFAIGAVPETTVKLLQVTEECMLRGIAAAVAGGKIGAIGHAVQTHAEAHGYGVVRELGGHGIGERLHEDPHIPNYGRPEQGPTLRAGMVIAIEPMINAGSHEVETLDDGWTVVTRDGRLSAHFEHTVAITDRGPEILTRCA